MLASKVTCILFFISFLFMSTNAQVHCSRMKTSFPNYETAYKAIVSTRFEFNDKTNTSKSSWIRGASYYSCDGRVGFFFLKTDQKNYIFKDVPLKVWNEFKNAPSHGKYYHANIKNRYYYYLSQ